MALFYQRPLPNGVAAALVPARTRYSTLRAGSAERAAIITAALYAAFTGASLAATGGRPPEVMSAARWEAICDAAVENQRLYDTTEPYFGDSPVPVGMEVGPVPDPYNIVVVGRNSERDIGSALVALIRREGVAASLTDLGECYTGVGFDSRCHGFLAGESVTTSFSTILASRYRLSASRIQSDGVGAQLLVNVYDRHSEYTDTPNTQTTLATTRSTMWTQRADRSGSMPLRMGSIGYPLPCCLRDSDMRYRVSFSSPAMMRICRS
jgi:hypothetical protein